MDQIPALKRIKVEKGNIVIGAMSTLEMILGSELIASNLSPLQEAVREVGSPLLRSVATIGGNICQNSRCRFYNQSSFWRSARGICFKSGGGTCHVTGRKDSCSSTLAADLPPLLISYGAKVKLTRASGVTRVAPLEQFYTGNGKDPNQILAGSKEILTEVLIPIPSANVKGVYKKFRFRNTIDFPLVGLAVTVKKSEEDYCENVRIVMTGVAPAPVEAIKACGRLQGEKLETRAIYVAAEIAASELRLVKADLVSSGYKKEIIKVLIKEALGEMGE